MALDHKESSQALFPSNNGDREAASPIVLNSAEGANNNQAFFSSNDHDVEAASPMGPNSTEMTGIDERNQGLFSSNDNDREVALLIGLNCAAMLVQVVFQNKGGGGNGNRNMVAIYAIVLSLSACFGSKYFSRSSIIATRICSSVALFFAALAMASLLAMPLHETLKCIPYALLCFFPLLSLLPHLLDSLKWLGDQCGYFIRQTQQQAAVEVNPTSENSAVGNTNQPNGTAPTGGSMITALPPQDAAPPADAEENVTVLGEE